MSIDSLDQLSSVRSYLARIGAEARGLKTAVVREQYGEYWRDLATIHFGRDGSVVCVNPKYAPTAQEEAEMRTELCAVKWPQLKLLHHLTNLPPEIQNAPPEFVFEFRNEAGLITMVQVRQETDKGKKYRPWTYWDDDKWRMAEPDGPLPLYNQDKLQDAGVVFIHEGAKAARACTELVSATGAAARQRLMAHPWGQELALGVHIGWIGGALSPARTDWSVIARMGVKRAYIVADNDEPGKGAVPAIAQALRIPTFMVQFTDEFPGGFDLADQFPEPMFRVQDGSKHYVGPTFRDCLHPATWATDLISNPRGKPTPVLRESFKEMWAYVEEADLFVCTEMPEILRPEPILNKMLGPFSHVSETSKLIVKSFRGRTTRICYRPDHEGLAVTFRGSSAINLHVPGNIRSTFGDPSPWIEFIKYLFVNPGERAEVERWCATLIARPDIRIGYGLLLVSERQGVGKTTLGAHVLAPLVGPHNVGYPSETDIGSQFNDWMANKRLVVVNEIYSGASWKAYHALKSVITDRDVTVNQKFMRPYTIENWCHVVACSNSLRALKMENDDRRWFYPEVTEEPWPSHKFIAFRRWLESGGLGIIKHWAEQFGNYIAPSDRAPMTERKKELIEGSRSEAQKEAAALADYVKDLEKPAALAMKDVVMWVRNSVQGKVHDSDYELRKAMVDVGMHNLSKRMKVGGRLDYILVNPKLYREVKELGEDEDAVNQLVRSKMLRQHEYMPEVM